jgi:hypothetical protein
MLAPRERQTLLAALRPPEGFRVDQVVATTFTLDLTALLMAPLAFSLLDSVADDARSGNTADQLDGYALLRAAREHAEQMVVFCEATRIAVPRRYQRLFTYLERSVVQVMAPHEQGVFHPKVWVLRMKNDEQAVHYRFLCSTRNLTFDRSWDTLLTLDGGLSDRTNAISMNRPLSEFVAALPGLAEPRSVAKSQAKLVERVADELLRVKFELPPGVDSIAFHPLGIGKRTFPEPERAQRVLIASPFVDAAGLERWTQMGSSHVLIGRCDQLDALESKALSRFASTHVITEALDRDDTDEGSSQDSSLEPTSSGLHAKLFVVDDGWDAHVWTGSANATDAGFTRNVEFLTELVGKKSVLGVQKLLDDGLSGMLQPYERGPDGAFELPNAALEAQLCAVRRHLARVRWIATVGERDEGLFPFSLKASRLSLANIRRLEVRPLTMPSRSQRLTDSSVVVEFGPCTLESLTPFFVFNVEVERDGTTLESEFVLKVELTGAPATRQADVLASMFKDPHAVLRFLSMLLADDSVEWLSSELERSAREDASNRGGQVAEHAVLERLLRALHDNPAQLDSVETFLRDLSQSASGTTVVTEHFLSLWEPILAARKALKEAT